MKRKLATVFLAMLLLICTAVGLTACKDKTCEHSYSEWTESKAATCTGNGEETRTCAKCGNTETRSTEALGHDFSEEWTNDESGHWHACKNTGCNAKSNEDEHSDHDHYCYYCGYKTSEHDYTVIEYNWMGNDYCEAVRTCVKCSADAEGHVEKAIATVTPLVTQNKTCELPELTKYTATFAEDWAETQTKENVETAAAVGHEYAKTGTTDENGHYHLCIHGNCGAKSTYAETDKNNDYACDLCGENLSVKLKADLAALVGDGTNDNVTVTLNLNKKVDATIFEAIVEGLENAKDGSVNLTINGAETIPSYAFAEHSKLKSVTLGDGVKSIESYAFYKCENLLVVTLGSGVENIGFTAFSECCICEVVNNSSLTIEIGSLNCGQVARYAKSVHSGESRLKEWNDYLVICADDGDMLVRYVGKETQIVLPDKFKKDTYTIASSAFENSNITSITIPASVIEIGKRAFGWSRSLTTVIFTENSVIDSIGEQVFYTCYELTSIKIPSSVKTIGVNAFANCSQLETITFERNCQVENIGDNAFANCSALESISIPSSIKAIGECVFENCDKLAKVTFEANCQLEKISDYVFRGCSALESISIPSSITSIGKYAFATSDYSDTEMHLKNVTFETGSKLTVIDEYAFYKCGSLVSFVFPDSVTTINGNAFNNCKKLMTVTLGTNLTTIEDYAFAECYNLFEVVNNSELGIDAGIGAYGCVADCAKIIHKGESKLCIQGDYAAICSDDGDTLIAYLGIDTEIVLPNKFKKDTYAVGNGVFKNGEIVSVSIPASVTSIGDQAFYCCNNLTMVTFGSNSKLSYIGDQAFCRCSKLMCVAISGSGVEIGNRAFYGCSELVTVTDADGKIGTVGVMAFFNCNKLTSIAFAAETKKIEFYAFQGCSALTTVTFADTCLIETIGQYAFESSGITSITIPASVTSIGQYAFASCKELTTVTFESNSQLTTVEDSAFCYCGRLSEIVIPSTVTMIGTNAFSWSGLTSLTFEDGSGLTSIGNYAFYWCEGLNSIKFGGTTEQWKGITFGSDWNNNSPVKEVACNDGTVSLS